MKIKGLALSSAIAIATFFPTGNANAGIVSCDGCTSQQMKDAAQVELFKVGYHAVHYPVYVTNFGDGSVRKYVYQTNVGPDFDWEIDYFKRWVTEGPVDPSIKDLVRNIDSIGPGPVSISVQSSLPDSVWDVVSNVGKDDDVREHLSTTFVNFRAKANDYARAVNPFPGFDPSEITYSVEVNFPDGSKAAYDYTPDIGDWVRRPGSARDKHGNLVPEKESDYTNDGGIGEYEYPSKTDPDLDKMLERAALMGIYVGPPKGTGGRVRVACTKVGNTTYCEIFIF